MPKTIYAMPDGPEAGPTTVPADGGWAGNAWAWITGQACVKETRP